jgi:hypothetical protein
VGAFAGAAGAEVEPLWMTRLGGSGADVGRRCECSCDVYLCSLHFAQMTRLRGFGADVGDIGCNLNG